MKSVGYRSRWYYSKYVLTWWLVCWMLLGIPVQIAMADPNPVPDTAPSSANVIGNTVPLNWTGDGGLNPEIGTAAGNNIITWNNFDIGSNGSVTFTQNAGWILNNVQDTMATGINGGLNAQNCGLILVNPLGVQFGPQALVQAQNFVASSLSISDADFQNGLPYTFTGGGVGPIDVLEGAQIVAEEMVALIGNNVTNRGSLSATGSYVIMAAGEQVFLSQEGSNVVVEVAMADPAAHVVDQGGDNGEGPGRVEADHIILAAGDIWSTAIEGVETLRAEAKGDAVFTGDISAYAEAASDAVADVTIITGGDLTVDYDIEAEAVGNGVDNAIAAVTINAGGSVEVKSDGYHSTTIRAKAKDGASNYADVKINAGGDVSVLAQDSDVTVKAEAYADEYDAVLNQANIEITGENVYVKSENFGWWIDLPDDALVEAYAHDGGQNKANVQITANGEESGDVTVQSEGQKGDDVLVKAEAKNGEDNTATVGIDATGNVEVTAYGLFDEALVKAEAWNELELEPEIPEPEVIEDVVQEVVIDLTVENLTNTASVDISAGENVDIEGTGSGDAAVEAVARNMMEVDIDNYDNEVTVNLTVQNLQNNASVTIDAGGEGIFVEAYGLSSKVGVSAEAYNELKVDQHTGGSYWTKIDGRWTKIYRDSYAATLNLEVTGLENNADIDITADNGNVEAETVECLFGSEAKIEAKAWNNLEVDLSGDSTGNLTLDGLANSAEIDITAGYDVEVIAEDGGEAGIFTEASNWLEEGDDADGTIIADNITNNSSVTIDAGGNVEVIADCEGDCSDAYIYADAWNDVPEPDDNPENIANNADVDITAGEDVKVMAFDGGDARIVALTELGTDNTANVKIATKDGDVLIHGVFGDASIEAFAMRGDDNTSTIAIDAVGGDVKVIAVGENECRDEDEGGTRIIAIAEEASNSNTADVQINATATTSEYVFEGDEEVYLEVEGGDVKVIAKEGGKAQITAFAADSGGEMTNTANVTINATAAEGTEPQPVYDGDTLDILLIEPAGYEAVPYTDGGDVKVIAECGGEAEIEAIAKDGYTNTADVLICIDGGVKVEGDRGGEAEIEALAKEGYSNTASVGIGAKGEDGVEVIADRGGEAGISSKAKDGYTNTASTIACTLGGVDVIATRGGDAEIFAQAKYGLFNDAYVGVCAVDDVLVQAGEFDVFGCDAIIRAEAETGDICIQQLPDEEPLITTANAETVVVSHEGSIEVLAFNGGDAEISSGAYDAYHNDAYTGVCAEENVIVGAYDGEAMISSEAEGYQIDRQVPEDNPTTANAETVAIAQKGFVVVADMTDEQPRSAGIVSEAAYAELNTAYTGVAAGTELASAPVREEVIETESISLLLSYDYGEVVIPDLGEPLPGGVYVVAYGDYSDARIDSYTHGGYENIADTVVCAPGEVVVYKDGYHSTSRIKSTAKNGPITKATTQVYAREVYVDVGGLYHGSGIGAWTDSEGWVHIEDGYYFIDGETDPLFEQSEENGDSTLIIDSYSNKEDCPECPDCPDCPCEEEEETAVAAPAAPLYLIEFPEIEGCPVLMEAVALELGIPLETLQVYIANALATNPNIQPCEMCARLVNSAAVLRDAGGIAALAQVVNEFVTTPAPPSEEQMTSIATVCAEHTGDRTHYAAAGQWIDALAQYVDILTAEMYYSAGESAAFADQYVAPIRDMGNESLTAFVEAHLAELGG